MRKFFVSFLVLFLVLIPFYSHAEELIGASENLTTMEATSEEESTDKQADDTDIKKAENEEDAQPEKSSPYDLPFFEDADIRIMGALVDHYVGEQDTLHDIARHYDMGFIEMRAANPGVDSWSPVPGTAVTVPSWHIFPRAEQDGIVVNLAEMRLYYFKDKSKDPITFPLGIGRDGLETPLGETKIVKKTEAPNWYPTERMREENPSLPWKVESGPSNPLGSHALYLGWPTFLIHGTNKPWGIGRAVSSGCIRMYPEDIVKLFEKVPMDTKVSVVEQPIKMAIVADSLYLEVNPSRELFSKVELHGIFDQEDIDVPEALKNRIEKEVEGTDIKIDWKDVTKAFKEKLGYPVAVGKLSAKGKDKSPAKYSYN
jgi:L,D-transpeptidase ErfK/SrfK